MSRLSVLVNRPRRTLAALATVLVAVGITAASGADFTATSANADTTFATGTLTIENSKEAQAIFASTSDMRPGDPARVGTVDITNSGSLSGAFTLNRGTVVDSDLRVAASEDSEVIGTLRAGEPFALLDDSLGWAWGYAGDGRRVGYVRSEMLGS